MTITDEMIESHTEEELIDILIESIENLNQLCEAVNEIVIGDDEQLAEAVFSDVVTILNEEEECHDCEEIVENPVTRFMGNLFRKTSVGGPPSRTNLRLAPTRLSNKPTSRVKPDLLPKVSELSPDARELNMPGGYKSPRFMGPEGDQRRSTATGELLGKGHLPTDTDTRFTRGALKGR